MSLWEMYITRFSWHPRGDHTYLMIGKNVLFVPDCTLCAGHQSASYIKSDVELSFAGVEFIKKSIGSNCGKMLPSHST